MRWRAWRTASAVTAQVLTITASAEPRLGGEALHRLALVGVQPAAEGLEPRRGHASAPRKSGREAALEHQRGRPGHPDPVVAPVDVEIAAVEPHRHLPSGQPAARGRPRRRRRPPSRRRAWSCRRAPRPASGSSPASIDVHELDVGPLGKQRIVLDPRPALGERRPPRRPRPRTRNAGCPCRPRSAGPRAAARRRRPRAPAALRRQCCCGGPMFTRISPAAGVLCAQHAAAGAQVERARAGLVHQQPRDAARRVAAGRGGRAVGVPEVDASRPRRRRRGSPRAGRNPRRGCGRRARAPAPASPDRARRARRSPRSRCRARASSRSAGRPQGVEIRRPSPLYTERAPARPCLAWANAA